MQADVWLHVSTTGGHYQAVKMCQNYNNNTIKHNLKKSVYKLNQIIAEHGWNISVQET